MSEIYYFQFPQATLHYCLSLSFHLCIIIVKVCLKVFEGVYMRFWWCHMSYYIRKYWIWFTTLKLVFGIFWVHNIIIWQRSAVAAEASKMYIKGRQKSILKGAAGYNNNNNIRIHAEWMWRKGKSDFHEKLMFSSIYQNKYINKCWSVNAMKNCLLKSWKI